MNDDTLLKLENLYDNLRTNRLSFSEKMESVADFVNSDLKYVIDQVENGFERIEVLTAELDEANAQLAETEAGE